MERRINSNWLFGIAQGIALGLTVLIVQPAAAGVRKLTDDVKVDEVSYKGYFKQSRAGARVFIKTVTKRVPKMDYEGNLVLDSRNNQVYWDVETKYGVIWERNTDRAAIFRIEELGGVQSWIQLFQDDAGGVIGSDVDHRPTYSGQLTDQGKKLKLSPTEFGRDGVGCKEDIVLERNNGVRWVTFPKKELKVWKRDSNKTAYELYIQPVQDPKTGLFPGDINFNGDFFIGTETFSGMFHSERYFPGLRLLHWQEPDSFSAEGVKEKSKITAVAAPFYVEDTKYWFFDDDYNGLLLIQLSPGAKSCLSKATFMNND